jgi:hypothetical protein
MRRGICYHIPNDARHVLSARRRLIRRLVPVAPAVTDHLSIVSVIVAAVGARSAGGSTHSSRRVFGRLNDQWPSAAGRRRQARDPLGTGFSLDQGDPRRQDPGKLSRIEAAQSRRSGT